MLAAGVVRHLPQVRGCGSQSCSADFRRSKFVTRQLERARQLLACEGRMLITRPKRLDADKVRVTASSTQRRAALRAARAVQHLLVDAEE